jgi:hypothetical protein
MVNDEKAAQAQDRVIKGMLASLDKQLRDGSDSAPGTKYILEGFTDDELRTVRLFVVSFSHYDLCTAVEAGRGE